MNATVIVEKFIHAPIEKVWNAIANREQMRQWYFPVDDFKAEKGFVFRFPGQSPGGRSYMHVCTVTEVVPMEKLQYTWTYEGIPGTTLVSFELTKKQDHTLVQLIHSGLDSFPHDNPDLAIQNFEMGWKEIITSMLPKFAEQQEQNV